MASFQWNGAAAKAAIAAQAKARISAACIDLTNAIKADISQPGTLRWEAKGGRNKKGQFLAKGVKTVYNFTHSRPGNPPYKQTGHLRRSMTWEVSGLVGRVGTNLIYGRALELGSRRIKKRPFILPNFMKRRPHLKAIIEGTARPGGVPPVESNQSRSGHLGAGARKAGYA